MECIQSPCRVLQTHYARRRLQALQHSKHWRPVLGFGQDCRSEFPAVTKLQLPTHKTLLPALCKSAAVMPKSLQVAAR